VESEEACKNTVNTTKVLVLFSQINVGKCIGNSTLLLMAYIPNKIMASSEAIMLKP